MQTGENKAGEQRGLDGSSNPEVSGIQVGENLLATVRKYNAWSARCPSRRLLDLIADKWTTLVLVALTPGPKYYSQIRHDVNGISHKMLSQTLRILAEQHLVVRTVYPTVPPRVDYALTPLAETLVPTLLTLIVWAEAHASEFQLPDCPPASQAAVSI